MSLIRQAAEKLRGARHIEWVLLAGLLAAFFLLTGRAEPTNQSTALEKRMENVLSMIEGAGRVRVLVNQTDSAEAFSPSGRQAAGVVVVAEGADRASVRLDLVSAVTSLTGLKADKITVIKMKSN